MSGSRLCVTLCSSLGILLIGGVWPSWAQGQTSADPPSIRLGLTFFADYTYAIEPESTDIDGNVYNPSAFSVTRTYINVSGSLNRHVGFRVTPDITRLADTGASADGSQVLRLKYGYAQVNVDDWLTPGSWVRLGLQQTGFVTFEEDVFRYRFQGPVFVDREGYLSSSDAGVAFRYNVPANYGEVIVGLYNGETYSRAEANDQKAFQLRGTVRPFPAHPVLRGLRVTGFYHGDAYVKDGERTRAIGGATFEHRYVNIGYHYMAASDRTSAFESAIDGSGYSVWVTPRTEFGLEGLIRFDRLTPDTTQDSRRRRRIFGVAYWFPNSGSGSAALLFDYEGVTNEDFMPEKENERRVAVHVLVAF